MSAPTSTPYSHLARSTTLPSSHAFNNNNQVKQSTETSVQPQPFKTHVIKTKEAVYAASDEVLTHPYFTPVHASVYGSIAGFKAGLLISPLIVPATYIQEKLFPSHHFSFPFQHNILAKLETDAQKKIKKAIWEGLNDTSSYKLNVLQHATKIGLTVLYTVGMSTLVFGGVVGLLIQGHAQIQIANIRRNIYNQNRCQAEAVPEDKLVSHFLHQTGNQEEKDPILAYQNWCADLCSPKDAAINGFLSAATAKLFTLAPKLAVGSVLGLCIGAFQTIGKYKTFQQNKPFSMPNNEFAIFFKIKPPSTNNETLIVTTSSTTETLRKKTADSLKIAWQLAQDKKFIAFFKERFPKEPATQAVTESLLHLAAPAFWMGFLLVPPLVGIQLTDLFKNKIGISPPGNYTHFHLPNWEKRWHYEAQHVKAPASVEVSPATATSLNESNRLKKTVFV
jgi:hypothetical protein